MTTNNPNTVKLHRVLRAKPERVYRAFLNADAMAKWLPPNGFTGKVHQIDAKVGGGYKMSFTNFTTGSSHSFGGQLFETQTQRTHPLHQSIREPRPARRNANHDHFEASVLRHRIERHAGRHSRP